MDPKPTVRLHKYRDRPYGLRWRVDGRHGEVTSGTSDEREAMRAALRLEDDLAEGHRPDSSTPPCLTWRDFRSWYQEDYLPGTSPSNRALWRTSADHFERLVGPKQADDVDLAMVSRFRSKLIATGISRASVDTYVRTLLAGINWGHTMGIRDRIDLPRRRGDPAPKPQMRDRVMSLEEFERIVAVAEQRPKDGREFSRFLWGLWHSGMRIGELYRLSWNPDTDVYVDLGEPNVVVFNKQKNKKKAVLPMPPGFWEVVLQPGRPRRGRVFDIPGRGGRMLLKSIGKRIGDFGKKAGVVVHTETGRTATAHDIRASYLTNLAEVVEEKDWTDVAGHSDSRVTKEHYRRREAATLAKKLGW